MKTPEPTIAGVDARAYVFPLPAPRADATLEWDAVTMLAVHVAAEDRIGFGYSYCHRSAAELVEDVLVPVLVGEPAHDIPALHSRLRAAVRNHGTPGLAAMAVSALDVALWDLKAKLLGVPLVTLLGPMRQRVRAYASGGFCNQPMDELIDDVRAWAQTGFDAVKIKIGRDREADRERVARVRAAVGEDVAIMVDANGALSAHQACHDGAHFARQRVDWFEEPLAGNDEAALAKLRPRLPPGIALAAGEYAWAPLDSLRLLRMQAVDVLQADATRCGGVTGFLACATLSDAFEVPMSSHCAPSLHVSLCCAAPRVVHLEYFLDHANLEAQVLEGFCAPQRGVMEPDAARPGHGLAFRRDTAEALVR